MNDEEVKVIIFTKHFLKDDEGVFAIGKKETQTLLNLIEKQQAKIEDLKLKIQTQKELLKMKTREIEKKDKIIDLILEEMVNNHCSIRDIVEEEICDDRCIGNNNWTCFNHIKEYFENKVKESK